MIRKFHATAHLGSEKGIRQIEGVDVWTLGTQIVAYILFAPDGCEEVVRIGRKLLQAAPPESIRVAAECPIQ
jgi:hypothetical protein